MSNKQKKRSDKERKKAIKLLKETIDKDNVSKMMLSVTDGFLFNGYVIIEQTFDSDRKLVSAGVINEYPSQTKEGGAVLG